MENGNMNSTSGNVHVEEGAAPETSMLLRERIKRLMGNGVHASWKSLPEVKSSGLLQMLTETQIELEELKFCLITCEVAYNTELTELLNLSKRSVSWADPLPTFNRRTIASSVERVKRSSDAFLNAFEKQWNMKPVVNLTILNKTFTDMSLQFQNYITYCTQQEDLRVTLCTAKRSKYEVAVASFSNRLNIERVMLPLQHLKLYHLLFQDIHLKLTSTTNRLDIFHCKRILSDITKLLDECYKALGTLHGSKYIKELDRIVDESLHSFESEPAQSNVPKHQENIVTDAATFRSKQSSVSVDDTDSKRSELCTVQEVNQNRFSTVRERCKFFDLKSVESYSKDTVKRKDNVTFNRQKPLQDCKRKVTDTPLNQRSSPIISERRTVFEVGEANILCKRNSYPTKSKIPVSEFTNIIPNTTVKDREISSSPYQTYYRSIENEMSKKHTARLQNKLDISISCNVSKLSGVSSVNSIMSSHLCTHNFSRNLTTSGTELSCAKDAIGESSIRDKQKVGNFNISNNLQSSTMEERILPSSVLQDNGCQKQSESNVSISTTLLPLTVKCTTDKAHTLDELSTNGFHTGSETSTYEVQKEIQQHAPPNEEEKCSDHIPFDSKQVYEHVRQSSDMLSSMTKEISHNEEVAGKESYNIEEPQKHEQQIFISSYYLGYPNITCNPQLLLQKECVKIYEIYNDCKPMNESLNAEESGESITEYDKGINTDSGICENVYEECDPCLWKYNVNISDSGVLRHYKNVPLYQAYNFGTVKHSNAKVEENIYTETEHIYEEINFCLKPKTQRNKTEVSVADMEIKRPSGSSQRGLWVDIKEVIDSGLLDKLDANQIALHEAKYEIITSEASYYKSLLILDTVFITSKELTDRSVLPEKDYNTIFSSIKKVKQCSKKFLEVLLRGWQEDLKLGYLCQTITKFVYLGYFQDYVNCCASQIYIHETLQHLKLTNPKFSSALSKLQADPICQMFLLETFLILPMQRVTRLPLLVEAILRHLSSDHIEHSVWSKVLIQFQKIVKDCNEAAGRAQTLATNDSTLHAQPNNTTQTLNRKQLSQEKKKQPAIWNIFGIRRQKII